MFSIIFLHRYSADLNKSRIDLYDGAVKRYYEAGSDADYFYADYDGDDSTVYGSTYMVSLNMHILSIVIFNYEYFYGIDERYFDGDEYGIHRVLHGSWIGLKYTSIITVLERY